VILAGNHVGLIEPLLMIAYAPYNIEFLAAGDIPIDPRFSWLTELYGVIPINRGNLDTKALRSAVEVLKQGGVLGIFPEGGIWDPFGMRARSGLAWLSYAAHAPILPVGFGGMVGAFEKVITLKRPRLTMRAGDLIPPLRPERKDLTRREAFEEEAGKVMDAIMALLPEEDRTLARGEQPVSILAVSFSDVPPGPPGLGDYLSPQETRSLGTLLGNPILMDVLQRNLRLPVASFRRLGQWQSASGIVAGTGAVLNYLDERNPGLLTYRFGMEEGQAMKSALIHLASLAQGASAAGLRLRLDLQSAS
jgi:1-acyl-sn-glycerol-3-phosphate acyltransferase